MGLREKNLIERIRLRMQERYECRLFRRQSMLVKAEGRHIRVNMPGQADLDGFVMIRRIPCYLCIEAKTGRQQPSDDQLKRQTSYEKIGVIYHFVYEKSFDSDMDELKEKINAISLRNCQAVRSLDQSSDSVCETR